MEGLEESSLPQVTARAKSTDRESKQDAHKRKEVPPRRACRRNPSEMPSDTPVTPKTEPVNPEEEAPCNVPSAPMSTTLYQTNHGQYFALTPGGAIHLSETVAGLQPLSMTSPGQPAAAVLQYPAQPRDGAQQFYHMPGNKVMVQGEMSGYQLCTPTSSLPQGVVMAGSSRAPHTPQPQGAEARRKRELRLMKNREAAKECRRRKREYVCCLESRLSMLEVANKKLMEELQYFHEVYGAKPS